VVPFVFDQFFWGRRVAELGVGPLPVPYRKLSAKRLAAAIEAAVSDAGMRRRAAALGEQIRAEDGIRNAVRVIEDYLT
jgi:sterol 3beta-glucosyltransferase